MVDNPSNVIKIGNDQKVDTSTTFANSYSGKKNGDDSSDGRGGDMNERVARLEERVNGVEKSLDRIEGKLNSFDEKLSSVDKSLVGINTKLSYVITYKQALAWLASTLVVIFGFLYSFIKFFHLSP